jgi:hypothetical protein
MLSALFIALVKYWYWYNKVKFQDRAYRYCCIGTGPVLYGLRFAKADTGITTKKNSVGEKLGPYVFCVITFLVNLPIVQIRDRNFSSCVLSATGSGTKEKFLSS